MASQKWGPSYDAEGSTKGGQTDVRRVSEGNSNYGGRPESPKADEKNATAENRAVGLAGVAESSATGDRPGNPAGVAWG